MAHKPTTSTTLSRDRYGCLQAVIGGGVDVLGQQWAADRAILAQAHDLAARAAKMGLIDTAYDTLERDRKGRWDGSALHHEIYDLSIKRGRVHQVLLCVRETEGSKYGVCTSSKSYVILTRANRAIEIATANKAIAAKAAKQAGSELGKALAIVQGQAALVANRLDLSIVYKRLAVTKDGRYVSIYDGQTEYKIGEEIREAARQDHNGGIYCYPSAAAAKSWRSSSDWPGHSLPQVVLRCAAGGSYCRYDNGKISVSRLTPVEVVA